MPKKLRNQDILTANIILSNAAPMKQPQFCLVTKVYGDKAHVQFFLGAYRRGNISSLPQHITKLLLH